MIERRSQVEARSACRVRLRVKRLHQHRNGLLAVQWASRPVQNAVDAKETSLLRSTMIVARIEVKDPLSS